MDTIGLNLYKRESQLCMLAEDRTVVERRTITSSLDLLGAPPTRLLSHREPATLRSAARLSTSNRYSSRVSVPLQSSPSACTLI
jgi:hypothetical protein